MEVKKVPKYSGFIEHGYLQRAGPGWNGKHTLQYLMYAIPERENFGGAVALAYCA